jgi:hypothetical protein
MRQHLTTTFSTFPLRLPARKLNNRHASETGAWAGRFTRERDRHFLPARFSFLTSSLTSSALSSTIAVHLARGGRTMEIGRVACPLWHLLRKRELSN